MTRPPSDGAALAALLAAPVAHTGPQAGPAILVLPAPDLPDTALPGGGAASAGAATSRRLLALLMPAARAVLRRPRVRQLALRVLKRFPALYARAYRMLLQGGAAAEGGGDSDLARLSARGAAVHRALLALETKPDVRAPAPGRRRRLAFVCPMPPQRTGIATYAVDLLPELARDFDIELVVDQESVQLPPALASLPVRQSAWFAEHGGEYDQVLYQFGNSPFHGHMFALLQRHPGVVVLHDFFLGGALLHAQASGALPQAWTRALLHAHGYAAVRASEAGAGTAEVHKAWPANLGVLETATRVIVHSQHARRLAADWYGAAAAQRIDLAPLPRTAPPPADRRAARAALGIADDVFLVCSFGFVAPNKLTHELLQAWLASTLGNKPGCALVLVGANHDSPYGARVEEIVRGAGPQANIRIAGWCDGAVYHAYLQAADVGVQLRTNAHGESSAAVLDCLNHGLPTIANANGSMAELPDGAFWRLPDAFEVAELGAALESLHADPARRRALGERARDVIEAGFRPAHCAAVYRATLDRAAADGAARQAAWRAALAQIRLPGQPAGQDALLHLAAQLAHDPAAPLPALRRQLLVDVSSWADGGDPPDDVRRLLLALLQPAHGLLRVEPVVCRREDGVPAWRYARNAAGRLLGLGWGRQDEPLADLAPGDVFLAPDALAPAIRDAADAGILAGWRAAGILVNLRLGAAQPGHAAATAPLLRALAPHADRWLCPSEAIAQQLAREIA